MVTLKPGFYPDSELTVVDSNGQRLANKYAPSWLAASRELYQTFGWYPKITVSSGKPVGAYRTDAEQKWISPGTSSYWSDHCKGRAVDIGNFNWFHNVNTALFIQILAKHGWRNVNTGGRPFPSEPWHFANQSSSPAGGGTLIGSEQDMKVISDGKNHALIGFPGSQSLSNQAAVEEERIWGPRTMLSTYEFGRAIIRANSRAAALPSGGGGSTDLKPVLDAVAGVSTQVSNLPVPPSALENGAAARAAIVK